MISYLVIREGPKWTDVYRLVPGRTVTIGRASTNQVVVKDDRCSRSHAEVFYTQDKWTLRDLGSRNGTMVGSVRVTADHSLSPGDVIRIGACQMAFVHDLSAAFGDGVDETAAAIEVGDSELLALDEPTTITHRRDQTRYLLPAATDETVPKVGESAAKLCRLAFELAQQNDTTSVAQLALDGLFDSTPTDAGAMLLLPLKDKDDGGKDFATGMLEIVASRSDHNEPYHRVSDFLAETVVLEGEAVLARNVADDSVLMTRDSRGLIHATSVICAPIRQNQRVVGLFHLYSMQAERRFDPDDLEFTLAVAENVALALRNLERQQELAEDLSYTRNEIQQLRQRLGSESELIGESAALQKVQQEIARAAPSRATVLIRGESGVGKELVARAMHFASARRKGPFVCLNCAALSESILESELFGHERGAFTGATGRKIGKFEAAHQGTLMLDEIGEMSPSIQAKFLRVLEGHPFERLGGNEPIKVDVRVIAATNRNLEKAVREGTFRQDLFFRLHVVEVNVPPLRKRGEDIVLLATHFLKRYRLETGHKVRGFSNEAIQQMLRYRWPGNVRELKNVVERAMLHAKGNLIELEDLTLTNLATASESGELGLRVATDSYEPLSLAEVERRHILATLKSTNWNKSRAATILGIERSTLDRKIRRYQISSK
ncbi:MAG: sigma 54-interacting transcriptional regulator [Planctomycetales bacterium]|nr:sigma 54-interacting transcriptional regulator [Planctomycetales bacterium]